MPTPDDQPVTALYERWVKAGPPPLGVSLARWWDRRLVELRDAIIQRNDANNAEQSARTTADNSPTSKDAPDSPLRDQLQAVIESEVYEFRERTMWWPEGEITKEIARLATRGATEIRDRELEQLRAKVAEFDHIINWHTTCASCARILDSSYQETMRAETAEAVIAQVQEVQAFAERVVATSGPGPGGAVQAVLDRLRDAIGQQDGEHVYLSTGCRHGDHDYCKNPTGRAGAKRPAECKHCGVRCICPCHKTSEGQSDV